MEHNSFYGGRKGDSFILSKAFSSIEEMTQSFALGNAYSEVNFDEYVLINTENKNDPDNGKLFKRGYDFNSGRTIQSKNGAVNAAGAIYVGTIVGPAGIAPDLRIDRYSTINNKQGDGKEYISSGSGSLTLTSGDLLPGKSGNTYNDGIQWIYKGFRTAEGTDTQLWLGFKVPYPVIDFTAVAAEPYNSSGTAAEVAAAARTDDQTHPFYEKWQITVPKGIKGTTLQKLKIRTKADLQGKKVYDPEDPNTELQIGDNKTFLGYELVDYTNKQAGTSKMFSAGMVKNIDNVDLVINSDDSAKFVINYTDATSEEKPANLNHIKEMKVLDSNKHLVVYYSDPTVRAAIPNDQRYVEDGKVWLDLGYVLIDHGLLVGKNVAPSEAGGASTEQAIIAKLNEDYPGGLQGTGLAGKVITYGEAEDPNKQFFAFDYSKNTWYSLGTLAESQLKTEAYGGADTQNIYTNRLREYGIWLVTESMQIEVEDTQNQEGA